MANYTVNTLPENTKIIAHKIWVKDVLGNKGQIAYIRTVSGTNPKTDDVDKCVLEILQQFYTDINPIVNEYIPSQESFQKMRKFFRKKTVATMKMELIQSNNSIAFTNQAGQSFSKYDLILKVYSESVSVQKSFDKSTFVAYVDKSNHEWAKFADALDATFCQYYDFFYNSTK